MTAFIIVHDKVCQFCDYIGIMLILCFYLIFINIFYDVNNV